MLCFNLLVPCFPLDCSQIIVSLLCLRGWPKMEVALTNPYPNRDPNQSYLNI